MLQSKVYLFSGKLLSSKKENTCFIMTYEIAIQVNFDILSILKIGNILALLLIWKIVENYLRYQKTHFLTCKI